MSGDLAPVAALHAIARHHRALLVIDEAHSFGVLGADGSGAAVAAGIAAEPDVVRTVTLSKSLGGQGGVVLAAAEVRQTLVDTGRGFIFDTGLAPRPRPRRSPRCACCGQNPNCQHGHGAPRPGWQASRRNLASTSPCPMPRLPS